MLAIQFHGRPIEVTKARGRHGVRGQVAFLHHVEVVSHNDLVDLVLAKAGDLKRRVVEDQLLELKLQLIQVPDSLLVHPLLAQPEALQFRRRQAEDLQSSAATPGRHTH